MTQPGPSIRLVADGRSLGDLRAALRAARTVGLDTEFHAERRYRPTLLLVQIATDPQTAWLADPTRIDLRPLADDLAGCRVAVHGGQEDLRLLQERLGRAPERVWDTQQAAGLLGMGYPRNLAAAAREVLGESLDKHSALSDWSIRPLSERQQRYAAQDALSTLALYAALAPRLEAAGREGWLEELGQELRRESLEPEDPALAWRTWEAAWTLDPPAQRALEALLRWREDEAQRRDQPAQSVLSVGLALDLARRRPRNLQELAENRRFPQNLLRQYGAALLKAAAEGEGASQPLAAPPTPPERRLYQAISLWAEIQERREGVAAALLLPPALRWRVAAEGAGALAGWRGAFQEPLRRFLAGEDRIVIQGGEPDVVFGGALGGALGGG